MEKQDRVEAIMWCEDSHRCELWATGVGHELRVYVSDVLTHTEPVRFTTRGLQQAARLLANARAAINGSGWYRRRVEQPAVARTSVGGSSTRP